MVKDYVANCKCCVEMVLQSFSEMLLRDAIQLAASGFWDNSCLGRRVKHPHQHRLNNDAMACAARLLMKRENRIGNAQSFEELLSIVKEVQDLIQGIGDLWAYDVANRIFRAQGRRIDNAVYLHADTQTGFDNLCNGLNVNIAVHYDGNGLQYALRQCFPAPLNRLSGEHIENFLCIFKDRLTRL